MSTVVVPRAGIYFAEVDGEGVLVDLARDRYIGLTAVSARIWRCVIQRLSVEEIGSRLALTEQLSISDALEIVSLQLSQWESAALISSDTNDSIGYIPAKELGVPAALGVYTLPQGAQVSARCCLTLLRLGKDIRRAVRDQGLLGGLRYLQAMPAATARDDKRTVASVVGSFAWSRAFFRQGDHDCLVRSLVLAAALRRHGVESDFCLGVQKLPFMAHAWVEIDRMALNERGERLLPLKVLLRA
jgi:hypothetical protein